MAEVAVQPGKDINELTIEDRAEILLGLLTLAVQVGEGKDIINDKSLLLGIQKNIKGQASTLKKRFSNNSNMLVNRLRTILRDTHTALDQSDLLQNQMVPQTPLSRAASKVITPEEASKVDGVNVLEQPAIKTAASIDLSKLMDKRVEEHQTDATTGKKIMPGNVHTEVLRSLQASSVDPRPLDPLEAAELSGLY